MTRRTGMSTATTPVVGACVGDRPGHVVRAATVQFVVGLGGEDGCRFPRDHAEAAGPLSPDAVPLVLAALTLTLALERGRVRLVSSPKA
jgi:hypothetical protein